MSSLPYYDGRTPLTKEAMNEICRRVTQASKIAGAGGVEVFDLGSIARGLNAEVVAVVITPPPPPPTGEGGTVIPDILFVYASDVSQLLPFLSGLSAFQTVPNNTKPMQDPLGGDEIRTGFTSLPDGWPVSTTQPFAYHRPVFGATQTINDTPVREKVFTVTPAGDVTGGTFRLGYSGEETPDLAWNSTASQIQAALDTLLGTGHSLVRSVLFTPVSPTPDPVVMQAFLVRFTGELADEDGTLTLEVTSSLTGPTGNEVSLLATLSTYGALINPLKQTLTFNCGSNAIPSGTMRLGLTASGPWSSRFPVYASAEEVQQALQSIPALAGKVQVRGTMQASRWPGPMVVARNDIIIANNSGVFTYWAWASGLEAAPLNAITLTSSLTGGAMTWTVFQHDTAIPLHPSNPLLSGIYSWAYSNVPLDRDQFWSHPEGWLGPWKYACWYGKFEITGNPTGGSVSISKGGSPVTIPWSGQATFTLIEIALRFLTSTVPGTNVGGTFLPINDVTLERPIGISAALQGGSTAPKGLANHQFAGHPWTIFFDDSIRLTGWTPLVADVSDLYRFTGSAATAMPTGDLTITPAMETRTGAIKDPYHTGIIPLGVSTGLAPHTALLRPYWIDYPTSSSPTNSLLYDALIRDSENVPFLQPTSTVAGVNTQAVRGVDKPPERFVLAEPGGYQDGPDARVLELIPFVPWRVRLASGISSSGAAEVIPYYQYYNARVVQPRAVDRRFNGIYGNDVYALFDPVALYDPDFGAFTDYPSWSGANGGPSGASQWKGVSIRQLIYPRTLRGVSPGQTWPSAPQVDHTWSPLLAPAAGRTAMGLRVITGYTPSQTPGNGSTSSWSVLPFEYFLGVSSFPGGFSTAPIYRRSVGTVHQGLIQSPPRYSGFSQLEDIPPLTPLPTPGNWRIHYWPGQEGTTWLQGISSERSRPALKEDDEWDQPLKNMYCGDPGKLMSISGCVSGRWQTTITALSGNTQPLEGQYDLDDSTLLFNPGLSAVLGNTLTSTTPFTGYTGKVLGPWTTWQTIVHLPDLGCWMGLRLMPVMHDYYHNLNPAWYLLAYFFETGTPNVTVTVTGKTVVLPDNWGFPLAISEPIWPVPGNCSPVDMTFTLAVNGALRYIPVNSSGVDQPERNWWQGSTPLPIGVISVRVEELPVVGEHDFWLEANLGGGGTQKVSGCWGTVNALVSQKSPGSGLPPVIQGESTMRPMTGVGCLPVKLRVSVTESAVPTFTAIGKILDANCQPVGPPTVGYDGPASYVSTGEYVLYAYGFVTHSRPFVTIPNANNTGQGAWVAGLAYAANTAVTNGTQVGYVESFVLEIDSDVSGPTVQIRAALKDGATRILTGTISVVSTDPFQLTGTVDVTGDPAGPSAGKASRLSIVVTL